MTTEDRLKKLEDELGRANRRIRVLGAAVLIAGVGVVASLSAQLVPMVKPPAVLPQAVSVTHAVLEAEKVHPRGEPYIVLCLNPG
jgi:hypothetical protein